MLIWRVSNYADLSGRGGVIAAARWNPVNTPVVYCADHPASALLEMLVHIDTEDAPPTYQLLHIDAPPTTQIYEPALPAGWKNDLNLTRRIGSEFIASARAPLMAVPSVLIPYARNYLLNPRLVTLAHIRIVETSRHPIDARLVG
jgi:RES domain-containing protein